MIDMPYRITRKEQRPSAARRGYGPAWRKARAAHLRDNPLCVDCEKEGMLTVATQVDHIIPHRGNQRLFWDTKNWQSLCEHHHSLKTAQEIIAGRS